MTKSLYSSLLSCLDQFNNLEQLQELLEIAREQFEIFPEAPEKFRNRLDLLINCYTTFAEENLNQLNADLKNIRKQLAGEEE